MTKPHSQVTLNGSSSPDESDLLDTENPRSLINLLPDLFKKVVTALPDDFLHLDEPKARSLFEPSATDNRLRLNFWNEYDSAQAEGRYMTVTNIFSGVCSRQFFYRYVLADPKRVAWLLIPPVSYKSALNEIMDLGVSKLREIMDAPVIDPGGNLIPKNADIVLKAYLATEARVKGAVIQRVEQKVEQKSVNVNYNENSIEMKPAMTPEELARRKADVQAKLARFDMGRTLPEPQKEVIQLPKEAVRIDNE